MKPSETILNNYKWPGPFQPMAHQFVTAKFVVDHDRCFVLNDMGTGKTASVLWATDALMAAGQVKKTLIVAPLSTLNRVWLNEAFQLITERRVVVLHGSGPKRKQLYEQGSWDIGIVNFDGVHVLRKHIGNDPDLDHIIIDEATAYRNSQTNRFKLMQTIAMRVRRFWLMTGTPCPQAPTDAYGLALLLGVPDTPRFFGQFRRQTMRKVSEFKWVPRHDGYNKAFELLHPAIRYDKKDCTDLPPLTTQQWEVDMSKEQAAAYKKMQKEMRVEFAQQGEDIPAVNAADKINKLRQIACGVLRDTATEEYVSLNPAPRIEACREAIEMAKAKAIVVVPFKGAIRAVAQGLAPHYSCAVINGDVSIKRRNEIVRAFCEAKDPEVLLVHPKVMAHGLTLTVADTMIFYAPIYSNEEMTQIVQRINRVGQTRSTTVIELAATPLEWGIYDAVDKRARGEQFLLDLFKKGAFDTP